MKTKTLSESLENYIPIPECGCWIWCGASLPKGYGLLCNTYNRKYPIRAHRASWIVNNGPIPKGLHVLHTCDTPACINPRHLYLGTNKDNVKDREKKGRGHRGERHCFSKLTEQNVMSILQDSRPQCEIAAHYGVKHNTISNIKTGTSWKHIKRG